MKKLITLLTVVFLFAIALSSCKTHEKCPAYGSLEMKTEQVG